MSSDQKKIGSLKDRIARFDNPDAEPVVPRTSFGYGGSARKEPGNNPGKGLIGNRIPSYNARNVPPELFVAGKKQIENRGLYGNRLSGVSDHERPIASTLPVSTGRVRIADPSETRHTGRPLLEDHCSQPVEGPSQAIISSGGNAIAASNLSVRAPDRLPSNPVAVVARATEKVHPDDTCNAEVDLLEAGFGHSTAQQQKYEDRSDLGTASMEEVIAFTIPGALTSQSMGKHEMTSRVPACEEGGGSLLVDATQNVKPPASLSSTDRLTLPGSSLLPSSGDHDDAIRPPGLSAVSSTITLSLEDIRVPAVGGPETQMRVGSEDPQFEILSLPRRSDREATFRARDIETSAAHPEQCSDTQSTEAGPGDKPVETDTAGFINPEQPAVESPDRIVESGYRTASAEQYAVKGAAGFHEEFVKTRKGQYEIQPVNSVALKRSA